jgi:hypothetical protein
VKSCEVKVHPLVRVEDAGRPEARERLFQRLNAEADIQRVRDPIPGYTSQAKLLR